MDASNGTASRTKGYKPTAGAAALGGALGLLVGGPLIALGLAGGAAYAATQSKTAHSVGAATYATGATASNWVKDKDKEYGITKKIGQGIHNASQAIEKRMSGSNSASSNGSSDTSAR